MEVRWHRRLSFVESGSGDVQSLVRDSTRFPGWRVFREVLHSAVGVVGQVSSASAAQL